MDLNWKRLSRKIHFWGAAIIALPVIIVIISGQLLLLKDNLAWIEPPTAKGQGDAPTLKMSEVLTISKTIPEINVTGWDDIRRIDVRPGKGVMKIRTRGGWETQIDHQTGEVLQVAERRSSLIESIHDGTFFHDNIKLWVFLPSSIVLLILWLTGLYMFFITLTAKNKARKKT